MIAQPVSQFILTKHRTLSIRIGWRWHQRQQYPQNTCTFEKTGVVNDHRGINGYSLMFTPEQVALLQIYPAVMEEPKIRLLDSH